MYNKKQKLYKRINKKSIYKYSTSNVDYLEHKSQKNVFTKHKSPSKYIKMFIMIFYALALIIIYFLFFHEYNKFYFSSLTFKFKNYKMGDIVILKDENWYVIENSSKKEEYILLLSSKLLDLNFNNEIDIDDKVDYISANLILDKYIEKNNRMRFLTSQEYIGIRDNMNFGYFWEKPNWLAGEIKHNWWINSENSKFNYSINLNGTYCINKLEEKNYIRPVIRIQKYYLK